MPSAGVGEGGVGEGKGCPFAKGEHVSLVAETFVTGCRPDCACVMLGVPAVGGHLAEAHGEVLG